MAIDEAATIGVHLSSAQAQRCQRERDTSTSPRPRDRRGRTARPPDGDPPCRRRLLREAGIRRHLATGHRRRPRPPAGLDRSLLPHEGRSFPLGSRAGFRGADRERQRRGRSDPVQAVRPRRHQLGVRLVPRRQAPGRRDRPATRRHVEALTNRGRAAAPCQPCRSPFATAASYVMPSVRSSSVIFALIAPQLPAGAASIAVCSCARYWRPPAHEASLPAVSEVVTISRRPASARSSQAAPSALIEPRPRPPCP